MLETVDGKRTSKIAHADAFEQLLHQLGTERAEAVRRDLNRMIDELSLDRNTGYRTFSSS